jgi:microtubule-associated protein 1 light chain
MFQHVEDDDDRQQDLLDSNQNSQRYNFKSKKSLSVRREEVQAIRYKFPNKVPVIVEKYRREKYLPDLDKVKFLVPQELTLSQLANILRNRLHLTPSQAFFLFVADGNLPALSASLCDLHRKYEDEDGFLYVTYASQEVFGG